MKGAKQLLVVLECANNELLIVFDPLPGLMVRSEGLREGICACIENARAIVEIYRDRGMMTPEELSSIEKKIDILVGLIVHS